jgi:hypothetical protein
MWSESGEPFQERTDGVRRMANCDQAPREGDAEEVAARVVQFKKQITAAELEEVKRGPPSAQRGLVGRTAAARLPDS